jgi:hypothetical protein
LKVIEAGRLPNNWSAQTCELFTLNQVLKFLKDKEAFIYTYSKYAFGVVHTFGKICAERGMINSKRQHLLHKELIIRLLEDLMLPEEITQVHVPGHQLGNSSEVQENNPADEAAKEAILHSEIPMLYLTPILQILSLTPVFTPQEKAQLGKLGTSQTLEGKWLLPNGREVLSKAIMRETLTQLHQGSYWGVQVVCHAILTVYVCSGIYTLVKQITGGCQTCRKFNKQALRGQPLGERKRPFQSVQADYTELPQVGHLKYVFDGYSGPSNWVEAIPLSSVTSNEVVKIHLDNIIPQFGLIKNIDSGNGSHFTTNIIRELARALDIKWEYHTPWHPPSSEKVKRMNQTLKRQLTKLVLETRLPWTKCLPLALLRIRTSPQKDIGISFYEMLYGLPYLGQSSALPILKPKISFPEIMCSVSLQLYHLLGNRDCARLHHSNFQCILTSWEITF